MAKEKKPNTTRKSRTISLRDRIKKLKSPNAKEQPRSPLAFVNEQMVKIEREKQSEG